MQGTPWPVLLVSIIAGIICIYWGIAPYVRSRTYEMVESGDIWQQFGSIGVGITLIGLGVLYYFNLNEVYSMPFFYAAISIIGLVIFIGPLIVRKRK